MNESGLVVNLTALSRQIDLVRDAVRCGSCSWLASPTRKISDVVATCHKTESVTSDIECEQVFFGET